MEDNNNKKIESVEQAKDTEGTVTAEKKPAAKTTAAKTSAAKKATAAKAASSAAAASKSATSKSTATKTAAAKSTASKTAATKTATSKTAASKTTATKAAATKSAAAKKPTEAKASSTVKPSTQKKPAAAKKAAEPVETKLDATTEQKADVEEIKPTVVEEKKAESAVEEIKSDIAEEPDSATVESSAEKTEEVSEEVKAEEDKAETVSEDDGKEEESLSDKVRVISPVRMVVKRFFRSKLSVVGFVLFISLFVFSFLGPLFVPWGETEVDRDGGEPMYTLAEIKYESGGEDGSAYLVEVHVPDVNVHADSFTYSKGEDKRLHILGTDENGRDIFVRLMYGGRLSLTLSFLVVVIYSVIGVILGGLAGYFGGWVDNLIMRVVDILNCIPSLPILLIIGAILDGVGVDQSIRIYYMMIALTLLSWTGTARIVRGQILYLREQDYIVATEALGFSPPRKIFKHLVPNVMPQLIVSMTLGLGSVILTEASLSFLGLGVPLDMASWGQMVQRATSSIEILTYYANDWLPAGFMIIFAVVSFNFIGDGLRDALDPRMKR